MCTTVTYLFDPLCGWCYGASPSIHRVGQQSAIHLELAPTGLFAGGGRFDSAAATLALTAGQGSRLLRGNTLLGGLDSLLDHKAAA